MIEFFFAFETDHDRERECLEDADSKTCVWEGIHRYNGLVVQNN